MWRLRSTGSNQWKKLNQNRARQRFLRERFLSSDSSLKFEKWNKDTFAMSIGIGICLGIATYSDLCGKNKGDPKLVECTSSIHSATILATSALIPEESQQVPFILKNDTVASEEFDFIIIGYGNVGRSAEKTLLEKCPDARIMVVDSHSVSREETLSPPKSTFGSRMKGNVSYLTGSAMGVNNEEQTIDVLTSHGDESVGDAPGIKRIAYKHSILICSGVRGAPPPDLLVDEKAAERILELRSTQLPSLNKYYANHSLTKKRLYPVLPSQSVRQIATMAASQGAKLCVLGSDLEAVELAIAAAGSNATGKDRNPVHLLFGGAAPLGGMLPRYLSTAVSRRLRAHGVDVRER
jgi:hypothetical protein